MHKIAKEIRDFVNFRKSVRLSKVAGLDNYWVEPMPELEQPPPSRTLLNLFGLFAPTALASSGGSQIDRGALPAKYTGKAPTGNPPAIAIDGYQGFRGKDYADLVEQLAGVDLYDDYIPSHAVTKIQQALEGYVAEGKNNGQDESALRDLVKMFKAMQGKALVGEI